MHSLPLKPGEVWSHMTTSPPGSLSLIIALYTAYSSVSEACSTDSGEVKVLSEGDPKYIKKMTVISSRKHWLLDRLIVRMWKRIVKNFMPWTKDILSLHEL